MSIETLMNELLTALTEAGSTTHLKDWAQLEPASRWTLEELAAESGQPLPQDLYDWFLHMRQSFQLIGNYETFSAQSALDYLRKDKKIDVDWFYKNMKQWDDGRFADGKLADVYWQPAWVPIARDGAGNTYCVDLAPGPHGVLGQIVSMESQDGQGPYLTQWESLEAMLIEHLTLLIERHYEVDEEGFIEYFY